MFTKDAPATLWAIRTQDHHSIECLIRFVPTGVQIEIISNDFSICSRIFPTGDEALVWAEEERTAWQADGPARHEP